MKAPSVVPISAPAPAEPLVSRSSSPRVQRSAPEHSAFLPLLLGGLALLVVLGYQTYVLMTERDAMKVTHYSQQQTVDNATTLRNSLDGLAADTKRLADSGNPNAGLLVAELAKRGISINPQATAAAAAGATTEPSAASMPR